MMLKFAPLALPVAMFVAQGGGDVAQPIRVFPNVHVTAGDAARPHYEVQLCADPAGRSRLVGVMAATDGGRFVTEIYRSEDAAGTWRRVFEESPELSSFDPACAYGAAGEAYFVTIGFPAQEGWTHTAVLRSADGGRSWERAPAPLPRSVDRPYVTVDRAGGALYLHGKRERRTLDLETEYLQHLWIARSDDRGRTFAQLDVPTLTRQVNPGNGVLLADGTFVVIVAEIADPADGTKNAIKVVRSTTRGASIAKPVRLAAWNLPRDVNSTRIPVLAARGHHLYAAWPDARPGGSEIMFSASADGGLTWSAPVPLVGPDGGTSGFNPSIAVNADGIVGVLWYDKRDHPSDLGWGVRFAAAVDGRTFLPSVRVSEKDAVPGPGLAQRGRMSASGGDTSGLDASADGAFHAAWIDNRTGVPQVWSSRIEVRTAAARARSTAVR